MRPAAAVRPDGAQAAGVPGSAGASHRGPEEPLRRGLRRHHHHRILPCPSLRALSASLGVSQVADSKVQSFASDLLVSDYLRGSSDAEKVLRFVQVGGVALLIHTLLRPLHSNSRCADLPYRGSAAAAGGQSAAAGCATGASLTRLQ